jgi:hypothetical protein
MNGCYHRLDIHIHTSTDKDDADSFLVAKSRDGKVIVEITTVHLAREALKIEVRSDLPLNWNWPDWKGIVIVTSFKAAPELSKVVMEN